VKSIKPIQNITKIHRREDHLNLEEIHQQLRIKTFLDHFQENPQSFPRNQGGKRTRREKMQVQEHNQILLFTYKSSLYTSKS